MLDSVSLSFRRTSWLTLFLCLLNARHDWLCFFVFQTHVMIDSVFCVFQTHIMIDSVCLSFRRTSWLTLLLFFVFQTHVMMDSVSLSFRGHDPSSSALTLTFWSSLTAWLSLLHGCPDFAEGWHALCSKPPGLFVPRVGSNSQLLWDLQQNWTIEGRGVNDPAATKLDCWGKGCKWPCGMLLSHLFLWVAVHGTRAPLIKCLSAWNIGLPVIYMCGSGKSTLTEFCLRQFISAVWISQLWTELDFQCGWISVGNSRFLAPAFHDFGRNYIRIVWLDICWQQQVFSSGI